MSTSGDVAGDLQAVEGVPSPARPEVAPAHAAAVGALSVEPGVGADRQQVEDAVVVEAVGTGGTGPGEGAGARQDRVTALGRGRGQGPRVRAGVGGEGRGRAVRVRVRERTVPREAARGAGTRSALTAVGAEEGDAVARPRVPQGETDQDLARVQIEHEVQGGGLVQVDRAGRHLRRNLLTGPRGRHCGGRRCVRHRGTSGGGRGGGQEAGAQGDGQGGGGGSGEAPPPDGGGRQGHSRGTGGARTRERTTG